MIKDLQKFREGLFEDYAHVNKDGSVILGKNGNSLYKECRMKELPSKFQEIINKHMKTKHGMGGRIAF